MTRWLNVKLPLILVLAAGFLAQFKSEPIQDSLMNAYANKFFIGTALNSAQIRTALSGHIDSQAIQRYHR